MNIKQKNQFMLTFVAALALMAGLVFGASPEVKALTDEETQACIDKWGGRSTDPNDEQYIDSSDLDKFKASNCAKGDDPVCRLITIPKTTWKVINCKEAGDGIDTLPSTSVVAANINTDNVDQYTNAKIEKECKKIFSDESKQKSCIKQAKTKRDKVKEGTSDPEGDTTDPLAGNDCGGVETAIIKCSQSNSGDIEDNGVWGLLMLVLKILTAGVGIVAVGGIVYGAILYTTAEDKADQVKKATDIITNVVIGLIAFALMWALLNFIVPGGVFK